MNNGLTTSNQATAHKRKHSILVSIPCFWFVAGMVLVLYTHDLAGPRIFAALSIPQFCALIEALASATLVTYLLFGYAWLRLDHVERNLHRSVIQTFMDLALITLYFRHTRTSREYRRTVLGSLSLRTGCVLTCYAGAYVSFMALVE
jgi:hypothetical protein